MGQEAPSVVTFGPSRSAGKALLETAELIFRGDFRLVIPFKDIDDLRVEDGILAVRFSEGEARFELGALAAKWAEKIQNPRSRLDKLGVKRASSVVVTGIEDATFKEELAASGATVYEQAKPGPVDLIFFGADSTADLDCLPALTERIKANGAIWVVAPKGKGSLLKDTEIMAAARAAGLVDTKVAAFSDSHTALKLVIPVAKRAKEPEGTGKR
jgi:hypothetical protein